MGMTDKIEDEDDLILDLLAKDDTLASTLLYRRYYLPVYRYIDSSIDDSESTKDVVQELFLAIWEKRHALNLSKPLGKYLFAAAHNKAVNYIRDERRAKILLGQIVFRTGEATSVSADGELETEELAAVIKKAISLLPFKAKRVFIMSRKYGMTYQEIARHLLVTDKAVEKNMSKALALLRKFLGDYLKMLMLM